MRFRTHPVRILSLLVLLAVTNVYIFANGAMSSAKSANLTGSAKVLLGKLITMSNRPILVNGGESITGTTILSGAHLVTPATGLATVQLDSLGTVMVAPSSSVTIAFDMKSVTVNIASGDATLTTVPGITGTVIGPDGAPAASGPSAPAPAVSNGFENGEVAGMVLGATGLIIGVIAWQKAGDAQDDADAAAKQLAALRACLAGQTSSPVKLCTSF